MSADDVFAHPAKWQPISRATAVAIYWRVPVAVAPEGKSGGASWFDELSPYYYAATGSSIEGLRYHRYIDQPPQSPMFPNLGPSPNKTPAAKPPVEEEKFWINLVIVDEWGDFVPGIGATVVGPADAKGGGTSDAKGRVAVSNLKSGKSKVHLGKHLFFTDESKAGKLVKPEEVSHTMAEAETLGGVARKYGTTDGRSIYYYSGNAALKSKRAALGLVATKDTFKVPKTFVFEFPTKPDGEAHEYKLKVPAMLDITKVDAQFAPSKETLDIQYDIAFMAKQKVILEISSPHLDGGAPLFKRELLATEKSDGSKTFKWDGKATAGKIKDKHISPLYTPYKVKLYVDGKAHHTDEKEFQVLYHSIKLAQAPWTHDEAIPPEADDKKFVAYHLNRLGYWAGPVGSDFDDYLKISTILYKSNHEKFHKVKFTDYNDTIDAALKAALKAGQRSRPFIKGDGITNPKGAADIRVEVLTYEKSGGSEWAEYLTHRPTKIKERRTRPLIPLEAEILLKGKAGTAVSAPRAVGPAHIAWTFTDPPEDTSTQFDVTAAEPSRTKKFIDKALKEKGGGPSGDNCPKEYGGIREPAATNYKTPFVLGTKYECWDVKDDSGPKKVYSEAVVDEVKYPKRLGKAGVLFRPSYVAGDAYVVKAALEFRKDTADLPNKADLEKRHGLAAGKTMQVSTGTLTVKHFGEIAMVITWPARTASRDLAGVRTEFEKAYVDLTTGHATKKMTEVMTNDQYGDVVAAQTALTKAAATLTDDSGYAKALPAQGAQNAATYKALVDTKVITDFWDKADFKGGIREQLTKNLRGEHSTLVPKPTFIPRGFVLIETIANKPVAILKAPPGDNTVLLPAYIASLSSIGIADSMNIINTQDPDKAYYVQAHEMGHNCWLQHWENAGGKHDASHDKKDHNCAMAYPEGSAPTVHLNQKAGSYTPHFCGKCNLKIRGWDNEAAGFPAQS